MNEDIDLYAEVEGLKKDLKVVTIVAMCLGAEGILLTLIMGYLILTGL